MAPRQGEDEAPWTLSEADSIPIALTVNELLTLDLAAIKTLAAVPREIESPADDEWEVNPELQALWMETSKATVARPVRWFDEAVIDGLDASSAVAARV